MEDHEFSVDRRDLTDQAYELLKAQILARKFRPHEKLSVDRLAKRLGVSRTPAKDALNRLAADGLITIEPRVGSFVTPVTAKGIQEIFALRLLFELYAAEQGFATITPGHIHKMQAIVAEMAGYLEEGRYRPNYHSRFLDLDHQLHRLIVDSPGNDRLTAMYEGLHVHLHIAKVYYLNELENVSQRHEEHRTMVRAYAEQDLAALKHVLRVHITGVGEWVLHKLQAAGGIL